MAEEGVMGQQTLEPRRSRIPTFFRTPSTGLGWAAIAGAVGAIVLTMVINVMAEGPGPPEDDPWWWGAAASGILACMLASGVAPHDQRPYRLPVPRATLEGEGGRWL
jgi:hypothetical protein